MLKVFRNKTVARIVLWAILIFTVPAFVIVGYMSSDRSGKKGPVFAGLIENKKVSFDDFAKSISSIRCQVVLNNFNNSKALESLLKNKAFVGKLAWDRLILLQRAKMAKIKVSDADVVKFISSHPLFIRNGKFDDRIYQYFLVNSLGLYPRSFEELTRENLMIQKLTDMISKDVKISDTEVLRDYERDNSKFKISYVMIPSSAFTDKVKTSDEEIKKFYEEHKKEFALTTKDKEGKDVVNKTPSLDELKDNLRTYLSDTKARPLAMDEATKDYNKIVEIMAKNKSSFESAASKIGLKPEESKPFLRSEYVEGIGEGSWIAEMAVNMKKDEVSKPAYTRKGVLIFKVAEVTPFNAETFKKEKEDFTKKALADKKNAFIEDWLRTLEKGADLKIDLNDYEQYYK
jgi:hypothetical protein